MVAPSISSQFTYAALGQVISGIKALGFHTVVEAALGADMVAYAESKELVEKGILTSSCCPAFVEYIKKTFPDLTKYISHNLSPMATIAKYIKEQRSHREDHLHRPLHRQEDGIPEGGSAPLGGLRADLRRASGAV